MIAVVPWARAGDLLDAPEGVCLASLDAQAELTLDDAGRALLAHWAKRSDRIFVLDEARPALRRLLAAGVDVARPVCRATLERLAGSSIDDTGQVVRAVVTARDLATRTVGRVEDLLARVDERGHKKVARLESLVLRAFAALEHRGLPLDVPGWRALVDVEVKNAAAARTELLALAGGHVPRDLFGTPDINLESDAEVRTLLARAGVVVPDVARATLEATGAPLALALARFREAMKIVSTYGESFLARVDPRTGRIHATFVPLGASTGRVASRDPNLQNLPKDARFHERLRAPEGRALVTADYATCELRIVAEMSGDPVFLEAFARGEDLHSTVATTMFGVPVSKSENAHLRQRAKAINFGLVYGMGAQALGGSLGVDEDTARSLLDQYFRTFPRVRDALEASVEKALHKGYAETVLGRRLVFDRATLALPNARGELSRIAKNMPIQGTSADMTKLAMVRVHERLHDEHPSAGLVNTVHDELVVECAASEQDAVATAVREEMEAAHTSLLKRVPPLVEVHAGPHWMH
jgi:DNA polymerase-1